MALKAGALTTEQRFSDFMGITLPTGAQLTAMQALINAVSSFVETYTHRVFAKTVHTGDEYETERGQIIKIERYPVLESEPFILERRNSQLNEDLWETIDSQYYTVDYESGILHCMDGVFFHRTRNGYRLTYTSGYDFDNVTTFLGDTDGADIEVAVWLLAQDTWKNKGMASNIYQERIGDYSVTFQRPIKGSTGYGFSSEQALTILDQYVDDPSMGVLTPLQSI